MNVVVDTNVLISGLLRPFSPPGEIVRLVASGALHLCLDGRLLAEYNEVLHRPKFQFDADQVEVLIDQIRHNGVLVSGVLYGSDSLAGQSFQLTLADGSTRTDHFPPLVKPTLIADYHQSLAYRTDDGIAVEVCVAEAPMRMEDQRNFGDASYKSFTDNQFGDGQADQGVRAGQTLTLSVGVDDPDTLATAMRAETVSPIPVRVEKATGEVVIPAIELGTNTPFVDCSGPNRNRDDYRSLDNVTFGVIPGTHLYDNDTYMENTTAVVPEVATVRSFASCTSVRIDPISMKAPYETADMNIQGGESFAAAWCVRMVKYLALAKVDEAAFDIDEPAARRVLEALAAHAGRAVALTDIGPHEPVDAFGIVDDDRYELWVINKTLEEQRIELSAPDTVAMTLSPLEVRVV
jgi:hypothetical protein